MRINQLFTLCFVCLTAGIFDAEGQQSMVMVVKQTEILGFKDQTNLKIDKI